jgi:hypothetical protein
MLVTFEHLTEGNPDSPNFGKTITVDVSDSVALDIEQISKAGKRAAEFALRILTTK